LFELRQAQASLPFARNDAMHEIPNFPFPRLTQDTPLDTAPEPTPNAEQEDECAAEADQG